MRPDKHVKSGEECWAVLALLNGNSERVGQPWWYGSHAHTLYHANENSLEIRRYCADTMEPLTAKQVYARLEEYDEYLKWDEGHDT